MELCTAPARLLKPGEDGLFQHALGDDRTEKSEMMKFQELLYTVQL